MQGFIRALTPTPRKNPTLTDVQTNFSSNCKCYFFEDHEAWDPEKVSDGGPHDQGLVFGMMNSATHYHNVMISTNCVQNEKLGHKSGPWASWKRKC